MNDTAAKLLEKKHVIATDFVKNYIDQISLDCPKNGEKVLPSTFKKKSIYEEYKIFL